MSNHYFRFKQFTVHQDKCAMKVSTDACIQGAWTPMSRNVNRVLDIGTGTGLLALMQAQKSKTALIDALELDKEASEQATENVKSSDWSDRINVIYTDAVHYQYEHRYDLIISNPPFFNNSLLGSRVQRNMARHTLTLNYHSLFDIIKSCLNVGGIASVLLPYHTFPLWEEILTCNKWQVITKLMIHPGVTQPANRIVAICKPGIEHETRENKLFIKDADGTYTTDYVNLMQPFYLDKQSE